MIRGSFVCLIAALVVAALCVPTLALEVVAPDGIIRTPIEFGVRDLKAALAKTPQLPQHVTIYVTRPGDITGSVVWSAVELLPKKAESFVIHRSGDNVVIAGSDANGVMYGCLELAERLDMKGRVALDIREPIVQSPAVEFRAVNPFLTLPYGVADKDWWFLQDGYWEGYLDQLARARINWIDMHGMYDIKTTWFPNIYPYFITSEEFPLAGADPAMAARNLSMLNRVIALAKQRGIKFALMSYSATWNGPGLRESPYPDSEENLAAYTREVVRKMIEACPGLDMIGFRIGESGKSTSFFKDSYIPAIREAGRPIDLYTRTWLAKKDQVLSIGENFPGRFLIEIKYNGEQFGPPYIVAGGRMAGWHSYSYQDYYSWPRNYKIIYQIRANGTHRVFPWGNPELAARANMGSTLGGAIGACVEPIDAYYEKYDARHKNDSPNRWYDWQWQRDWFWYNVWGRTAYDPSLKSNDELWTRMFEHHFGKPAASDLFNAMQWASRIVPDAYTSYSLGPDHRNHAPELEWGGNVQKWVEGQPFDTQNIQTTREFADRLVRGDFSAKATPLQMAGYLAEEARMTRQYVGLARARVGDWTPEFKDLVTELTALSYLGDYYSHKLTAASMLAVLEAASDPVGPEYAGVERIREELALAGQAWGELAAIGEEHYKPFVDSLRMGTENYTWAEEGRKLDGDIQALDETIAAIKSSANTGTAPAPWTRGDGEGPAISEVKSNVVSSADDLSKKLTVTAEISDGGGVSKVFLKTKAFPSERRWNVTAMERRGDAFVGEANVLPEGLMWCIEAVDGDGNGSMWPNFRYATPYRVVLPWNAPMPKTDAQKALEAIDKVKPSTKDYSAMIAGRDAFALNAAPAWVKSAILDRVNEGLSLIVMCQDAPDNWDGGWLGILFTDADFGSAKFAGDHPILSGVPETIDLKRVINDSLEGGGPEWTHLSDPKGLAVRDYGKGRIILVQMDIGNKIDNPALKKLFANVMAYAKNGSDKPVLVIDPGSGAIYGLLGLYEQPYKTLSP